MLTNYLKIALRSLMKNKIYSFINITGLSVGMTVSILILIFVVHEFSYDRFHIKGERIFRAEKQFSRDGRHSLYANPQFGPAMLAIDPRVSNYVRLYDKGRKVVKSDDKHKFFEDRFLFADTSFFSIFSFPLVKGDRSSLSQPAKVIVTERMAHKYFGDTNAIGKILTFDSNNTLEVTGIAKNPPANSSIQFDFIASFPTLLTMPGERAMIENNSSGFPTYLLLSDRKDIAKVEQSILKTEYTNASITYSLAPIFENHFNLNFGDTSNTRYIFIFLCIALLILMLALINYMNLTTARATARAKEVGIRKVIGASSKTLSGQFYMESAITTAISFAFAVVLIQVFKPALLNVLQQNIDTSFLTSPLFVGVILVLLIACVLIAGSYPALVLPRFKPADVLNGKLGMIGQASWLRKGLTIFQFAASVALAICALVMNHQLDFLQSKDIGLQRQHVVVVPIDQLPVRSYEALKNELRAQAAVTGLAMASVPLYKHNMSGVALVSSPATHEKVGTKWVVANEEFLDVLGIPWHTKPEGATLAGNHILNETGAEAFGIHDQQKDYDLTMGGDHAPAITGKIIGITKDFNYETLRSRIQPMIISIVSDTILITSGAPSLYIRIDPRSQLNDKIASIKTTYEKYAEDVPFVYYFLDDAFNDLQKGENRLSKIFAVFTFVALCIAGLGLFGLVTFTAERKMKEITIRKLLGASLANILALLTSDLILMLLISIAIGAPLAWLAMQDWISHFFYQAEIPLAFVVVPSVLVILLSLAIICIQGIKVAMDDLARNLKNE